MSAEASLRCYPSEVLWSIWAFFRKVPKTEWDWWHTRRRDLVKEILTERGEWK